MVGSVTHNDEFLLLFSEVVERFGVADDEVVG